MYGRFENGKFRKAKHFIKTDNMTIINPSDEMYKQYGYKKVVEEEFPVLLENQGAELYFEESDNVILKRYKIVELEITDEISEMIEKAQAYDIITGVSE